MTPLREFGRWGGWEDEDIIPASVSVAVSVAVEEEEVDRGRDDSSEVDRPPPRRFWYATIAKDALPLLAAVVVVAIASLATTNDANI